MVMMSMRVFLNGSIWVGAMVVIVVVIMMLVMMMLLALVPLIPLCAPPALRSRLTPQSRLPKILVLLLPLIALLPLVLWRWQLRGSPAMALDGR